MSKKILLHKLSFVLLLLGIAGVLAACTPREGSRRPKEERQEEVRTTEEETEEEAVQEENGGDKLYLVLKNNAQDGTIRVYDYEDGQVYQYHFSDSTGFLDKYGNLATIEDMTPGKIVTLGSHDEQGILRRVQISDEVWEYPDVVRFSVDEERRVFTIADENYTWDDSFRIFVGDDTIGVGELQTSDKLDIVGYGKKLLSAVVTEGDGTLELTNTELFEGSYVQVGKHIMEKISRDMSVSVPSGTYILAVANNGWGGEQEITIERGETTTVDLDKIKGEGPRYGKVAFVVDVDDAKVYVDGEEVRQSKVLSITYGEHSLKVTADGYDTWTRRLFVNSEEATIEISLDDSQASTVSESASSEKSSEKGSETKSSESATSENSGTEASSTEHEGIGSRIGSGIGSGIGTGIGSTDAESSGSSSSRSAGSSSSQSSGTGSSSESDEYLKEYVSTLSNILNTIR